MQQQFASYHANKQTDEQTAVKTLQSTKVEKLIIIPTYFSPCYLYHSRFTEKT